MSGDPSTRLRGVRPKPASVLLGENRAAAGPRAERNLLDVLSGNLRGWPAQAIIAWLLSEGRRIADPAAMMEALCKRLADAGAPLFRMRVSVRTLSPQIMARGFYWVRGQPITVAWIPHTIETSQSFVGSPMKRIYNGGELFRRALDDLDETDHPTLHEAREIGGTDYLALPIWFADRVGGVITLTTDRTGGFENEDLTKFQAVVEALSPVIDAISKQDTARSLLDTYVGPRTGARVLNGQFRRGDGETIDAAMWFSDLRDFTVMTESMPIDDLLDALNTYFETVAAAVTARGGEILRFIGDAMLIVFPTSDRTSVQAACKDALDAARDAFASMEALNHRRRRAGQPPLRFGVGLHVGTVIYGNVGAPDRLDFTVMGPAVNRTARIESLTKELGKPLLMSADFATCHGCSVTSMGHHPMKGIAEPQEVFSLADAP